MSFAKTYSAQVSFLKAHIIDIEVDLAGGLHSFSIVGLPDKAVEEARDRISAAIKNSGFKSPKNKNQKVVISLAPADIKKEGPNFDLGMALAYLLATGDVVFNAKGKIFLGELSLDGNLRPIDGVLPLTREAKQKGFTEIYVPRENAEEAALIEGISVYPVNTLSEIVAHLGENKNEKIIQKKINPQERTKIEITEVEETDIDFSDIKAQETAKRGLEIAAAGGHNIAMYGPPGTGKTMLARAFAGILPALSFDDILETTAIHSVAGTLGETLITKAPFRAPHHTSSYVSLVGGGTFPKPGEVTLAHRGVLFLDEFPEFERRVIDALRQPLEDRVISISRARGSAQFPADFILIATLNPCPCGNFGAKGKECTCTGSNLIRYQRKISGPIIDRIDMWIEVPAVEHKKLSNTEKSEGTKAIKERIIKARELQSIRLAGSKKKTNSSLSARDLEKIVTLSQEVKDILNLSATKLGLSARAYHRVIKLARTIADLDSAENVEQKHILEALTYRPRKIGV